VRVQTLDLRALDLDSIDLAILPIPELKRLLLANNRITSIAGKEVLTAALSNAHVCSRMRTYAHVCSRMLTYTNVR
jgi:hypothetical protein